MQVRTAKLCNVRVAKPRKAAEAEDITNGSEGRVRTRKLEVKEVLQLFLFQVYNFFAVKPRKTGAVLLMCQPVIVAVGSSPA